VIRASLEGQHVDVVELPEGCGALQVQDVGEAGQLGGDPGDPVESRAVVDAVVASEQEPTRFGLLVDENDARACAGRRDSSGEARRSRADHQQVGVDVPGVVAGGVGDIGEPALARDPTGDESLGQLDRRGQQHRFGKWLLDLDQPVRVLRPGRGDPARAAKLDARSDLVHAVGEQRGCERVAGVPGQAPTVRGEPVRGGAVDPAAVGKAQRVCGLGGLAAELTHVVSGFIWSSR
jgi:hypothetical protein